MVLDIVDAGMNKVALVLEQSNCFCRNGFCRRVHMMRSGKTREELADIYVGTWFMM